MACLLIAAVSLTGAYTGSASAAPPVGRCPAPFQLLNRQALIDLELTLRPGLTRQQAAVQYVDPGLAAFDANGDGQLCIQTHTHAPPQQFPGLNVIDNKVQS